MRPREIPSTSGNFPSGIETFCELPSTFSMVGRRSNNFRQLSALPEDLPSTSVNFLCSQENFHQLPSNFLAAGRLSVNFLQLSVQGISSIKFCNLSMPPRDLASNSVNFQCYRATLHQLPSTFRAARRPFVNFHKLSVWPEDLLSNFRVAERPSVNFCYFSVLPGNLSSSSVSFQCGRDTFLGAAAGSPYVVFILHQSYGFMLWIYIYI